MLRCWHRQFGMLANPVAVYWFSDFEIPFLLLIINVVLLNTLNTMSAVLVVIYVLAALGRTFKKSWLKNDSNVTIFVHRKHHLGLESNERKITWTAQYTDVINICAFSIRPSDEWLTFWQHFYLAVDCLVPDISALDSPAMGSLVPDISAWKVSRGPSWSVLFSLLFSIIIVCMYLCVWEWAWGRMCGWVCMCGLVGGWVKLHSAL